MDKKKLEGEVHLGRMPQFGVRDMRLEPIEYQEDGRPARYRCVWYDETGERYIFEVDAKENGFWDIEIRDIMLDWINDRLDNVSPPKNTSRPPRDRGQGQDPPA